MRLEATCNKFYNESKSNVLHGNFFFFGKKGKCIPFKLTSTIYIYKYIGQIRMYYQAPNYVLNSKLQTKEIVAYL